MDSIAYQLLTMVSISFLRYGLTLALWHVAPLKTQKGTPRRHWCSAYS